MIIKILGTGCSKCKTLEKETFKTLEELKVEADVQKVAKLNEIMEYDVMLTPALVINEKVKVSGRVPKPEELKKLIEEEL